MVAASSVAVSPFFWSAFSSNSGISPKSISPWLSDFSGLPPKSSGAEVQNVGVELVVDDDVRGLQVAMEEAGGVDVRQPRQEAHRYRHPLPHGEALTRCEDRCQGASPHELRGQIREIVHTTVVDDRRHERRLDCRHLECFLKQVIDKVIIVSLLVDL